MIDPKDKDKIEGEVMTPPEVGADYQSNDDLFKVELTKRSQDSIDIDKKAQVPESIQKKASRQRSLQKLYGECMKSVRSSKQKRSLSNLRESRETSKKQSDQETP